MTERNPFDETPTVIRPIPGGRRAPTPDAPPQPLFMAAVPDGAALPADAAAGLGFGGMVTAAGLLLSLAGSLAEAPPQRNSAALRQRLLGELQAFDGAARAAGQSELSVRQADYILCATLDDIIANTEWGRELDWSRQSLARTRHNDATGGDQVFRLIDDYRKDPVNNLACLELTYFCLSLGFWGRMRVLPDGDADHLRLREDLKRILRQVTGGQPPLSPRWQGAGGGPKAATSAVPLWVFAVAAAAILAAAYTGLSFWLGGKSGAVEVTLRDLEPHRPVMPVPQITPPRTGQSQRLSKFLEGESYVQVFDQGPNTIVRLIGSGMFDSGSERVKDQFLPLFDKLARALSEQVDSADRILVTGHTDRQLIRYSLKFKTNLQLSTARAETVRDLLAASRPDLGRRIDVKGMAADMPVDPADTPEAYARNRRIDLIVPRQDEGDN